MNAARQLRRDIEDCELKHPAYTVHLDALRRTIDNALDGFSPRIEWVVGPSRVGKTRLLKALAREHPESKLEGRRHVPVLLVEMNAGVSPILLPTNVLTSLNVPLPPRGLTSGLMFNRMRDQLRLAGTKAMLIEEASHLVETGAKVPPRAAADWFKTLVDQLGVTVVMSGLPRLEKLFESNEQLRLRASQRREFRPYDLRVPQDQYAFASCIRTYADMFQRHGWPIAMPFESLVKNCYLHSGGAIGVVSRLMQDLASLLVSFGPRPLTLEDCRVAARKSGSNEHLDSPSFVREEVSPFELNQVHAQTLTEAGMSMPITYSPHGVR